MINWARVNELREEVGNEDFPDVVAVFLDEVDEVIGRIVSAATPEDMHFLKGSAWTLGLSETAKLCAEGEDALKKLPGKPLCVEPLMTVLQCERSELLTDLSLQAI